MLKIGRGCEFKSWKHKKILLFKSQPCDLCTEIQQKITLHYFEMDQCKVVENILMKHSVSRHLEEKFVQVVKRKQWVWPKSW